MIRLLLLVVADESSSSRSSSDETELASELEGDGEGGESVSCSWSIVRNSWMDSLRAHSCESNDRSSCRRPYISRRRMANWVSKVVVVAAEPGTVDCWGGCGDAFRPPDRVLLTGEWPRCC